MASRSTAVTHQRLPDVPHHHNMLLTLAIAVVLFIVASAAIIFTCVYLVRRYALLANQQQPGHAAISLPESTEGHEGGDECPICLSEFEEGDQICTLPCTHAFHQERIDTWVVTNPTCPLCRCSVVGV